MSEDKIKRSSNFPHDHRCTHIGKLPDRDVWVCHRDCPEKEIKESISKVELPKKKGFFR